MKILDDSILIASKPTCEGINYGFEQSSSAANYTVTTTGLNESVETKANKVTYYIISDSIDSKK